MGKVRTVCSVVLLAAAVAAPAQDARKRPFEVRYLAAHGRRVDTQFYDFTGDHLLDALVVSIDLDADPPVRWFALHVGKKPGGIPDKPDQIWAVHPETSAFALGNVVPEGGIEVLQIASDGVRYHAFEKGAMTEESRKLLHTRTFFSVPSPRALPLWMSPVDLSKDGLDDLIVPLPDGYKIYFQTEPGKFGVVEQLEADVAPGKRWVAPTRFAADWDRLIARSLPATSGLFNLQSELPRVTPVDLDGDGLLDLVSLNGDRMTIFYQRPARRYASGPRERFERTISVLEADPKRDVVTVDDAQFRDIDGDGLMDFIVTKIEGELQFLESIKTRIYPHLGTGRESFRPDTLIAIDGISLNPTFIDMDGDGALDVLTSRLRTDLIAKGVEKLLGDFTVTYEVFQFDKKTRTYSSSPVWSQPVLIRDEDLSKRRAAARPLIQVAGDLSGDRRPDAVYFNLKNSTLEVRRGKQVWAPGNRPVIAFEMDAAATFALDDVDGTHDPRWISYLDVDGDGRMDILLNYYGQLVMLLSRF